jgi:hypothetical protein
MKQFNRFGLAALISLAAAQGAAAMDSGGSSVYAAPPEAAGAPAKLSYDRALAIAPLHKGALEYEGEAFLETRQLSKAEANLVALRRACPSGCEELADLQSGIARYKTHATMN